MLIAANDTARPRACADFYVVALKVTASNPIAITAATLMLLFFYGLWFGFTSNRRGSTSTQGKRQA